MKSQQGVRFRQWATCVLKEYAVKGFALDDRRLKDGRSRYFRELLQRVRDIRSSERNLYQQVTDIYATAIDYDPKSSMMRTFFATVITLFTSARRLRSSTTASTATSRLWV